MPLYILNKTRKIKVNSEVQDLLTIFKLARKVKIRVYCKKKVKVTFMKGHAYGKKINPSVTGEIISG